MAFKHLRDPRKAFAVAIVISLLMHAIFFVDAFWPAMQKPKQSPTLLELTFGDPQAPGSTTPSSPIANKQSRAPVTGHPSKKYDASRFQTGFVQSQLLRLQTGNQDGVAVLAAGDPLTGVSQEGQGWSEATQYGNQMTLQNTIESLPYFEALYDRINGALTYPDDFARQRITGTIHINAELSRDGKLIRFLSSTADDRLLQTFGFALLMQVLSQPLPKAVWISTETAFVSFDFTFDTRMPEQPAKSFPRIVQKNRLGFARENAVDPIVNERINEIFTHYVPPIIPLPGGFYVDFVMAYQFVDNLLHDLPTERDKRQARIDALQKSLQQTIRTPRPTAPAPTPTVAPES